MTTIKKRNILDIGGAENIAKPHVIVRDEKRLLRQLASTVANTLTVLNDRRALLTLPPLGDENDGAWHVADELPSTYVTDAVARRLRFLPTDLALQADNVWRLGLQNNPWATYSYARGFKLSYQVYAAPAETDSSQPNYTTIAEVLARPTKGCVELAFNDALDLPVEGKANILGSPPLMEALAADVSLLRDTVTML